MADIARYPFVRHLRGVATTHVEHVRNGETVHSGTGASFWFRPLSAVLSEIPVDDRELPLLFHARTADFQDVTVQATLTYRRDRPGARAAGGSTSPSTRHRALAGYTAGAGRLACSPRAPSSTCSTCWPLALTEALIGGVAAVRTTIAAGLAADPRLAETGIAVVGRAGGGRSVPNRRWRGAADPDPRADPAGRRQGLLRAAGGRRRARARDQRERAAEQDRAGPPRGAAGRPARGQRPPRGRRTPPPGRSQTEAEARRSQRLAQADAEGLRVGGEARQPPRAPSSPPTATCRRRSCWAGGQGAGGEPAADRQPRVDPRPAGARSWPGSAAATPLGVMSLAPRVVIVHRATELDELLARHGTRGQAAFFLSTRGRAIDELEERTPAPGRRSGRLPRRSRSTGGAAASSGRPGPVPVRPGRPGRGGRAGRPGRERRQVPRRAAGHRHRPRPRAQPGGAGSAGRRRMPPTCCAPQRTRERAMVEARHRRRPAAAGAQRDLPRPPESPDRPLPPTRRATSGRHRPA